MFFAPVPKQPTDRRKRAVPHAAALVAERLEARRLLAFSASVNFQPAGAVVPAGYLADTGASYANRGNGFTYGWTAANAAAARERHATSDQRFDTLIHTTGKAWEISVPNGTYNVTLTAGDPSYFDSKYAFSAEGILAMSGTPNSGNRFISAVKTVTVNDGKLTIADAAGAINNKLAFLDIEAGPASPPPPPTGDVPVVPATIQAEDFKSFFDTTAANLGGQYRSTAVDVITASEGGYAVGYTAAGEWLSYTVNSPAAGTFALDLRYAVGGAGGVAHVEVDGSDVTGPIAMGGTGGWQSWRTLTKSGIAIAAGQHTLRIVFDKSNSSGGIANLNWVRLATSGTVTPTVSVAATDSSAVESGNT